MNSDSKKLNDFDQLVLYHLISNLKVESEKDYLLIISELIKDNTNLNVDAIDLYLDVKESEEEFPLFLEGDHDTQNQVKKDEDTANTVTINLEIDAEEGLKTLEKIKSAMDEIDARCESDNESNETIDPLLSAKKRLQDTLTDEGEERQPKVNTLPFLFTKQKPLTSGFGLHSATFPEFAYPYGQEKEEESEEIIPFPTLKELEEWEEKNEWFFLETPHLTLPERVDRYMLTVRLVREGIKHLKKINEEGFKG